jgi:hypothetical protein
MAAIKPGAPTLIVSVFTKTEIDHAVAYDTNGLTVYPAMPIKYVHTPIKPVGDEMWLRCSRCKKRKPYGHFDYSDVALKSSYACIPCKLHPLPKEPREWRNPRDVCSSVSTGKIYMFCRTCGFYWPTDSVEESRLLTHRRLCNRCHAAEYKTAKLRPYIVPRRPKKSNTPVLL